MPGIIKETMKQNHTSGPWSVSPGQDTIWANDGDTKVAKVWDLPWIESEATGRRHSDDATERANATLIAAAPELLEALKGILAALNQPVQFTELRTPASTDVLRGDAALARKIASAAISKATSC